MWKKLFIAALVFAAPVSSAKQEASPWPEERMNVLVLTGENNHDWRWTSTSLFQLLEESGKFEVEVSIYPEAALSNAYDLEGIELFVLDYNGKRWGEPAETNFLEAVKGGAGVVVMHASNNAFEGWTEYEELVGHLWREGTGHGEQHAFDVRVRNREHPLTTGLPDLQAHFDELYHGLVNPQGAEHEVLATAWSDPAWGGSGEDEPVLFAGSFGKGRVAHTSLGHVWNGDLQSRSSYVDPKFQQLVIRMAEWAATGSVTPLRRVAPNTLTQADIAAGWKLLFDGQSNKGWRNMAGEGFPAERWAVEDGALRLLAGEEDDPSADIVASGLYDEFELEVEWRVLGDPKDAGLFYRMGPEGEMVWRTALDVKRAQEAGLSVPYDLTPAEGHILRPVGEYNHARVVARKDHVEHWLNGIRILDFDLSASDWAEMMRGKNITQHPELEQLPLGHVALSGSGEDVWFRNIKIRRPPPEPARAGRTTGIELFNGRDLEGWTRQWVVDNRPVDVWTFDTEGNLVCKGLPIGYIRTNANYTNYVLELDWRYHPTTKQTGVGGVLLRTGEEHDAWPRCMEVRFEYLKTGDVWSHWEFPFDTVHLRTDGTATLRIEDAENHPGEWNHCKIRLNEGTLTVEVNGRLVNELQGLSEEPGGIGLKSAGVEMHYRNVRLTPIE